MSYRWDSKPLVDERLFISTTVMKSLLKSGGVGTLGWNTGSTIGYRVPPDRSEVVLNYTITHRDDSSEDIEQHISLTSISKPYGGKQYFYLCPSCGRRYMNLYLGDNRFYCRRCLGLNYRSTRQPEWLNACDKALELCKKLDPDVKPLDVAFAEKPRHMHWDTYYELKDRISDLYYGGMRVFLKMPVPDVEEH